MEKELVCSPEARIVFDGMYGCSGCKDLNSTFVYTNAEFANILGFGTNHLEMIGRSDDDMPCGTSEFADRFREQDQLVLTTGKGIEVIDIHPFAGGVWKPFIFRKTPYRDLEGNIIGLILQGEELGMASMNTAILRQVMSSLPEGNGAGQITYMLKTKTSDVELSTTEADCLYQMLRGTKKHIVLADKIGRSHRTVPSIIRRLQKKFEASSEAEMVCKAHKAGFFDMIPGEVLSTQMSVVLER